MRRELVVVLVGSALALFVYAGATATDTRVGSLITAVQTALESEMEIDPGMIVDGPGGSGPAFIEIPAGIAFLLLLFGGLPLAVFGLLYERQWAGVPMERRRHLHVPYAVFMFQIVSTLLSGFLIVTLGPIFLSSLGEGWVQTRDWFMPAYLFVQTLAGVAAIPTWRRLLRSASDVRSSLQLTRASRV